MEDIKQNIEEGLEEFYLERDDLRDVNFEHFKVNRLDNFICDTGEDTKNSGRIWFLKMAKQKKHCGTG